jgi:hypothetical protein
MRFAASCSGVSSWMSKNQLLGMLSSRTGADWAAGAEAGVAATVGALGV